MGSSVSLLPPLRRWPGHGFLAFLAMALLALFAVQILASTFRPNGLDGSARSTTTTTTTLGSDGTARTAGHQKQQAQCCCGGFWEKLCCPASRSSPSGPQGDEDAVSFGPASGQLPLVSVSNNKHPVSHAAAEDSSSTFSKQTMRLFQPLLSFAAGAWCSHLADQPWSPSSSSSSSPTSSPAPSCAATTDWPGFSGMRYIFSFGDSFTTTWFNWRDNPPSPSTPLGNPEYPGFTSASGANWIDYLTVKYNQSLLQTYNLAIGGAAVDQDIQLGPPLFGRVPFEPERKSLKDQVLRDFITGYAYKNAPGAPDWNGGNALFTIWIGINDAVGSYARGPDGPEGTRALNERIFATYTRLIETLYDHGARNFMFLNVPAVDRSPVMGERGRRDIGLLSADLNEFNDLIAKMALELKQKYEGLNAWVYDTRTDFSSAIDDPRAFDQTSGLKNVTDKCDGYANIWPIPNGDMFLSECGVRLTEYFWRDGLHPTSAIHEVVAAQASKLLQGAPNVCGGSGAAKSTR